MLQQRLIHKIEKSPQSISVKHAQANCLSVSLSLQRFATRAWLPRKHPTFANRSVSAATCPLHENPEWKIQQAWGYVLLPWRSSNILLFCAFLKTSVGSDLHKWKKGVKSFPVVTTTRNRNAIAMVNLVPPANRSLSEAGKKEQNVKVPPAGSARTTPLHKNRLQMTKKTAPARPYVLHFSRGHSQYVPQNAMCLLWERSRRVQLSEYAEPTAKSSKLSMFASFGEDGAKHLASKSYQVRTCVLCLRRPGVVWLSLTQFLFWTPRSPMGTQQCLRSDIFWRDPHIDDLRLHLFAVPRKHRSIGRGFGQFQDTPFVILAPFSTEHFSRQRFAWSRQWFSNRWGRAIAHSSRASSEMYVLPQRHPVFRFVSAPYLNCISTSTINGSVWWAPRDFENMMSNVLSRQQQLSVRQPRSKFSMNVLYRKSSSEAVC